MVFLFDIGTVPIEWSLSDFHSILSGKKYTEKLVRNDIGTGNRKEVYREKCKE